MNYIERAEYMQRLLDLMGTPDIKIITGVRRSGKSELMKAYIRRIRESQPDANIIFVDFYDLKYEGLKEYHALYDYIENHYDAEKPNYVFVDEVQLCQKFELAINSLHTSRKYDLYITGSNAFLLSSDLTTLFTGRYIEIHVDLYRCSDFRLRCTDICKVLFAQKDHAALLLPRFRLDGLVRRLMAVGLLHV